MVTHAGSGFGSEDVARSGPEEVEHRCVVPVRRVRYVDDDPCLLERFLESLAVYV